MVPYNPDEVQCIRNLREATRAQWGDTASRRASRFARNLGGWLRERRGRAHLLMDVDVEWRTHVDGMDSHEGNAFRAFVELFCLELPVAHGTAARTANALALALRPLAAL